MHVKIDIVLPRFDGVFLLCLKGRLGPKDSSFAFVRTCMNTSGGSHIAIVFLKHALLVRKQMRQRWCYVGERRLPVSHL